MKNGFFVLLSLFTFCLAPQAFAQNTNAFFNLVDIVRDSDGKLIELQIHNKEKLSFKN